jgi:hypothetical protein
MTVNPLWPLFSKADAFYYDNGAPLSGGTLTVTLTGTSTVVELFSDPLGVTPISNPYTLDSRGGIRSDCIYVQPNVAYRLTVNDISGNQVSQDDGLYGRSVGVLGTVPSASVPTTAFANLGTANRLIGFPNGAATLVDVAEPLSLSGQVLTSGRLFDDFIFLSKTTVAASSSFTINLNTSSYTSFLIYFVNMSCSAVSYTATSSTKGTAVGDVFLFNDLAIDATDTNFKAIKTSRAGQFGSNTTDSTANMVNNSAGNGMSKMYINRGYLKYESFYTAGSLSSPRQAWAPLNTYVGFSATPLTSITVNQTSGTLSGLYYLYGRI